MAERDRAEHRSRRDEPIGTEVLGSRGVQIDAALLPQLEHGDRRDELGDRRNPEDRVRGDPSSGRDVPEPVPGERVEATAADDAEGEANRRVAMDDLADPGVEVQWSWPSLRPPAIRARLGRRGGCNRRGRRHRVRPASRRAPATPSAVRHDRRERGQRPLRRVSGARTFAAMPLIPIGDARLFVEVVGHGPPIVLMHGGPGADHWTMHAFRRLADRHTLVFYDHRCNGRSEGAPVTSMTWDNLTADAEKLREHLGFERWAVLGHSFGGHVALEYALRIPGEPVAPDPPRYGRRHDVVRATTPRAWPASEAVRRSPSSSGTGSTAIRRRTGCSGTSSGSVRCTTRTRAPWPCSDGCGGVALQAPAGRLRLRRPVSPTGLERPGATRRDRGTDARHGRSGRLRLPARSPAAAGRGHPRRTPSAGRPRRPQPPRRAHGGGSRRSPRIPGRATRASREGHVRSRQRGLTPDRARNHAPARRAWGSGRSGGSGDLSVRRRHARRQGDANGHRRRISSVIVSRRSHFVPVPVSRSPSMGTGETGRS